MAESYLPQQADTRTFGAMQTRLLDDLNRPELTSEVVDYIQDAIRYFQRQPFFFSEQDNRMVPPWQASTIYPHGATIYVPMPGGLQDAFVALSPGAQQNGATPPAVWPTTIYQPPPGSNFYHPPPPGTPGTVADGSVIWGNIGQYIPGYHTQLTTVPNINQYIPPVDYVSQYQVQLTVGNMRLTLEKISYQELSGYDVIQPAPIAAYPQFWAYWRQRIYLWVYPAGFYPMTLDYYSGPSLVSNSSDTNYWTTTAERLIRKYAQAAISREILYDQDAAQLSMSAASEELSHLKTQLVAQQGYRIPAWEW